MRFEHEATPVRVDERMALAAVDLSARIVTARAAGLGGLDALAVDEGWRRAQPVRDLPPRARGLSVQSVRHRARWQTSGK
jgi:hypothetical protein